MKRNILLVFIICIFLSLLLNLTLVFGESVDIKSCPFGHRENEFKITKIDYGPSSNKLEIELETDKLEQVKTYSYEVTQYYTNGENKKTACNFYGQGGLLDSSYEYWVGYTCPNFLDGRKSINDISLNIGGPEKNGEIEVICDGYLSKINKINKWGSNDLFWSKQGGFVSVEEIIEKIKEDSTSQEITESKPETATSSQPPKLINKTIYYIIGGILLLAILGFFTYNIIKNRPKKEEKKGPKEEKDELIEEEKPVIGKDIKEAISVSNFTLKYNQKTILDNINFNINRGEMVCLLGPSGTGKSTIIEALVGRKKPTEGTLKILDKDISKDKNIFDCVGFVPQHPELYMNQTVEQNLLSSATKWGIKKPTEKVDKILSKISLSHRKDLKAGKLSGGQQKLLSLGMELIRDIEVCILDEPTTGLDPNTRNNIITILSNISSQLHKTIFFTTHFMEDAEECDNVIILSDKTVVAQGPPTKLERMLPGGGKIVNIILDNVTDNLLEKIEKIEGVLKIIREGRNLKIITNEPNAIGIGHKINEVGGIVNETKIDKATMMEVFVYYTGKKPDENA